MNLWQIREDSFNSDLKALHGQETVYTIGNGYFCTRGTFEEGFPRDVSATLLFGVFDKVPVAKEELANAPDWTIIQLFVNGERFRLDRGKLLAYERVLDMQQGSITRTVRWESPSGIRVRITSSRFASLADEHIGAIRYSVEIEKQPELESAGGVEVALWSSINTAQGNYDLMHWENIDQGHQNEIIWLQSETKHSHHTLAQTMSFEIDTEGFDKSIVDSDFAPSIRFSGTLEPGETLTTEKIVVMYTSRDVKDPITTAIEQHKQLADTSYDLLFEAHKAAWADVWQRADVLIEGDAKAQLGVRYNIYQLCINCSTHDSRYSIAAKGMTGFGYRGHVFHDTEIFMLPFFTCVLPERARNLLLYRYHTLPAARQKAASNGFQGAQYAWESASNGEETTPPSIVHPENGEVIPVLNGLIELHITGSIAHAVWEYWQITGDDEFMCLYGAEMLLSMAMFWASRAEKNPQHGDYEVSNVIGPDEWHEHVDNNAYTNYTAKHAITTAITTLQWLKQTFPEKAQELEKTLSITPDLLKYWHEVAEGFRILQDPQTSLIEQFDGFFQLKDFDQSRYEGRTDSYQGILGLKPLQQYRIIKQADVLMLLTVLDQEFDLKTKQTNWDYYYPITDHDYGSSLTPALHVILACELGQFQPAYELFMKGALVDLEDLRLNTGEGIHAACAGAVWQAAVFGFAGLRINHDGYTTNPKLPDGWQRLAFNIVHRGKPARIDIRR